MRPRSPLAPFGTGSPIAAGDALIAVPVLFAGVLWAPILGNYFFGDDLLNLYSIVNKGVLEYLITPYGGHLLATRNAIYALCFRLFGTDVRWYFLLVLLTHLLNVVLLFGVIRVLTHSPRLACLGATLWGSSPLDEGALGWYSVYGHVLATTIFLWLFYRLSLIGAGQAPGRLVPWSWAALLLAASTSFGVGIAVTLVFPLMALLLLPPSAARTRLVAVLIGVALLVVGMYVGLHRLAEQLYPNPWAFKITPFDNLQQRARIAVLTLHLIGFGVSNLLLGPFAARAPYGGAGSTAVIGLFALALVLALVRGSAAGRRRLIACLLVSFACYGIIAAGRVSFFTTLRDLLVQSTRYHYLAPLPIAVALCLMLGELPAGCCFGRLARDGALAGWLGAMALGFNAVGRQIDSHSEARQFTAEAVAEIDRRIAGAAPGEDVYIENRPFAGVGPFLIFKPRVFPGLAAVFTVFYPDNVVAGRRVFFVVAEPDVRAVAAGGKRTATLLVPPDAVPGTGG